MHNAVFAQNTKTISLIVQPVFSSQLLSHKYFKLNDRDSIQIEVLKFYLSNLSFYKEKKEVWREKNSFHLIDSEKEESYKLMLEVPLNLSFDEVTMNLGVDSVTNNSGAMGGDLDPTKGMYWTWQSGYINVKLEGKSNLCKTRKNSFEFHLGGYQYPFNSLQRLDFNVTSPNDLLLVLDVAHFFSSLDLEKVNQIMTPSAVSNQLSQKLAKAFILKE